MKESVIGLISGTGPQGRGLAVRFALAGVEVIVGSRNDERAQGIADELNGIVRAQGAAGENATTIRGMANAGMIAKSDFVLLTVPFEHAESTLQAHAADFREGNVFVDVTVPLEFGKGDAMVVVPAAGSGALQLRKLLPANIPFLGAFKTLPAHVLEEVHMNMRCDTFVFGDVKDAKLRFIELVRRIPTLRPIDVGGLSAAATLEGMTALLIRINRRWKSQHARFSVVGLGE